MQHGKRGAHTYSNDGNPMMRQAHNDSLNSSFDSRRPQQNQVRILVLNYLAKNAEQDHIDADISGLEPPADARRQLLCE